MHLFTHVRAKIALLFAGAFLWGAQAYAETEVVEQWDFQELAKTNAVSKVLTSGEEYIPLGAARGTNGYPIGQPNWSYSSYSVTEFGTSLAFARLYDTSKRKGFWLAYTSGNDAKCGLQTTDAHTMSVLDLSVGSVVTVKGSTGFLTAANKYTYGGEWTESKSTDGTTDTYVYTITTAGDLNLLCVANSYIYSMTIEAPIPDVYKPTISVIEGSDNTSKKIQVSSKTADATITCTIEYEDGTSEEKTIENNGTFRIYKSATTIKAQATVGSGDSQKTSDVRSKSGIKAGVIAKPTASVTKVSGLSRIVKLASTDTDASLTYNTTGSTDDNINYDGSEITISTKTTFNIVSKVVDAYDNSYTHESQASVTIEAGSTIALNAVTYSSDEGKIIFTADQSSVLCKPTVKINYSFIRVNEITGEKDPETTGVVESGSSVDLGYGLISATASAEGYDNSELTSAEYAPLDLKAVRSWDFTQYADQTVSPGTSTKTVSGTSCTQVAIGGTAIEDIYTQETWTAKTSGLYNGKGGYRFVVVDNVKKGQVIRFTLVKGGSEALDYSDLVNGTRNLNSTATSWVFNVIEDGTFAFKLHRYNYIKSIEVSEDLSASRTISYDAVTGYATFYWNKTIEIPSGVKAYTGELNKDMDALNLTEIEGGYIPALTPAILVAADKKGESDVVTEAEDVEAEAISSSLKGILIAQTASEYVTSGQVYVLSRKEDASSIGFYKFSGETLAANKAYLVVDAASAAPMVRFNFDEGNVGNVTGIESIEAENGAQARIFDLQGRSLRQAPLKGIYIQDGHKVIR